VDAVTGKSPRSEFSYIPESISGKVGFTVVKIAKAFYICRPLKNACLPELWLVRWQEGLPARAIACALAGRDMPRW